MKLRRVLAAALVLCLVLALWVPVHAGELGNTDAATDQEIVGGPESGESSGDSGDPDTAESPEGIVSPEPTEPTASPGQSPEPTAPPTASPEQSPEPTAPPTASPEQSPEPTAPPTASPEQSPEPTAPPTANPEQSPEPTAPPTASPEQSPEPTAPPTASPEQSPEPTGSQEPTRGPEDPEVPVQISGIDDTVIDVSVPSSGEIIINPYRLETKKTGDQSQIVHEPQQLKNNSEFEVTASVSFVGTVPEGSEAVFVSRKPAPGKKEVFLYVEFRNDPDGWMEEYTAGAPNQVVATEPGNVAGVLAKPDVLRLEALGEGYFRLSGAMSNSTVWEKTDTFGAMLMFSFTAVPVEAEDGADTADPVGPEDGEETADPVGPEDSP